MFIIVATTKAKMYFTTEVCPLKMVSLNHFCFCSEYCIVFLAQIIILSMHLLFLNASTRSTSTRQHNTEKQKSHDGKGFHYSNFLSISLSYYFTARRPRTKGQIKIYTKTIVLLQAVNIHSYHCSLFYFITNLPLYVAYNIVQFTRCIIFYNLSFKTII